jgi:hypothetical protein
MRRTPGASGGFQRVDEAPSTQCEGQRLRKRFVWYKEGAFPGWPSDEADRSDSLPHAWLFPLVYQALQTANSQYQLYATWEQAVNNLAEALARLRALLQPPTGRKEK